MHGHLAVLGAAAALLASLSAVRAEAPAPTPAPAAQPAPVVDAKWQSAGADALRGEINRVGEQIREKIGESMALQDAIRSAADNPAYTSPEIAKRREAIAALEKALVEARIALQAEVAKHPDVAALAQKNQGVLGEVGQLRVMKKALAQRLAERLSGKTGGN